MTVLVIIGALVLAMGISFLEAAVGLFIICWAFGLVFSWKIAIGIWVIILLLRSCFKTVVNKK